MSGRIVQLSYREKQIAVSMGAAKNLRCNLQTEHGPVHYVDTGVPHAVFFVDDVTHAPFNQLAFFFVIIHCLEQKGANVNLAALQSDGSIQVRTFERGVEGETLACGAGACAVAAVTNSIHGVSGLTKICFPGGVLEVLCTNKEIEMRRDANRVFKGIY